MSVKLLTEHHLEFLSLKGGCTGLSESTLVKMPRCWKSHTLAHILVLWNSLARVSERRIQLNQAIIYKRGYVPTPSFTSSLKQIETAILLLVNRCSLFAKDCWCVFLQFFFLFYFFLEGGWWGDRVVWCFFRLFSVAVFTCTA